VNDEILKSVLPMQVKVSRANCSNRRVDLGDLVDVEVVEVKVEGGRVVVDVAEVEEEGGGACEGGAKAWVVCRNDLNNRNRGPFNVTYKT
jgi:hypothetical protein